MNSIPRIFNEHEVNLTRLGPAASAQGTAVSLTGSRVEGGAQRKMDVSVVLLSSDTSRDLRKSMLMELVKCPFAATICVEKDAESFNMESLSRSFPDVRFIMPLEHISIGEMINIAMAEAASRYVLVLRDTLRVGQNLMQPHFFERLTAREPYCIVPRLVDHRGQMLTTQFVPEAERGHFSVGVSSLVRDGMPTLYPFDFIGVYNREKFIQLGGFDYTIESPYYQNLDLALRSWLWGEQTVLSTSLLMSYYESDNTPPIEDTTTDSTYLHFYLKNILPHYKDGGVISSSSFLRFLIHASLPLFEARAVFQDARQWVEVNSARFHTDLQHLIEEWGAGEESI